jgi:hypothetical protein
MKDDRWWIVLTDDGYKITNHPLRSTDPVRGPFDSYDAAVEYKEWWERKQMSRERMAAYVVILWVGFAMVVFAAAGVEMIRGFFR